MKQRFSIAAAAAVLVLVLSVSRSTHAASDNNQYQKLIDWLIANGGQWNNLQVGTTPAGYRGVIATEDIPEDAVMALIPLNISLDLPTSDGRGWGFHRSAVMLAKALKNESSHLKPYFESLPADDPSPLSIYTMPESYIPYFDSKNMITYLNDVAEGVTYFWHYMMTEEDKKEMTYAEWVHALSILSTRCFGSQLGCLLLPAVDMFNHYNNCPTNHEVDACPHDANVTCEFWRPMKAYKKGEEVCFGYGGMFNDHSFAQYGFIVDSKDPELFGMDRHDFDPNDTWANNVWLEPLERFHANTTEEVWAEVKRLRALLRESEDGDYAPYVAPLDPLDPDGTTIKMLMDWRELRQIALRKEIDRLMSMIRRGLTVDQELTVTASPVNTSSCPVCDCAAVVGEALADAKAAADAGGDGHQKKAEGGEADASHDEL